MSDLRETVGRYDERISNIKENMVTKDELTRQWLRMLMFALMLLIPVLAAVILPHRIGPPLGYGKRRTDDGKEALQA